MRFTPQAVHIPPLIPMIATTEKHLISMETHSKPYPMDNMSVATVVMVTLLFVFCSPCWAVILVLFVVACRCLKHVNGQWSVFLIVAIVRGELELAYECIYLPIWTFLCIDRIGLFVLNLCIWVFTNVIRTCSVVLPRLKAPLCFLAPTLAFLLCAFLFGKVVASVLVTVLVSIVGFLISMSAMIHFLDETVNTDRNSNLFVSPVQAKGDVRPLTNAILVCESVLELSHLPTQVSDAESAHTEEVFKDVYTRENSADTGYNTDNDYLSPGSSVRSSFSAKPTPKDGGVLNSDEALLSGICKNPDFSLDCDASYLPGDDVHSYCDSHDHFIQQSSILTVYEVFHASLQYSITSTESKSMFDWNKKPSIDSTFSSHTLAAGSKSTPPLHDIITYEALGLAKPISIDIEHSSAGYTSKEWTYSNIRSTLIDPPHEQAEDDLAAISPNSNVLKSLFVFKHLRERIVHRGCPDGAPAKEVTK